MDPIKAKVALEVKASEGRRERTKSVLTGFGDIFPMLRYEGFLVVSLIALEAFFENSRQLPKEYLECWHLCQASERVAIPTLGLELGTEEKRGVHRGSGGRPVLFSSLREAGSKLPNVSVSCDLEPLARASRGASRPPREEGEREGPTADWHVCGWPGHVLQVGKRDGCTAPCPTRQLHVCMLCVQPHRTAAKRKDRRDKFGLDARSMVEGSDLSSVAWVRPCSKE